MIHRLFEVNSPVTQNCTALPLYNCIFSHIAMSLLQISIFIKSYKIAAMPVWAQVLVADIILKLRCGLGKGCT